MHGRHADMRAAMNPTLAADLHFGTSGGDLAGQDFYSFVTLSVSVLTLDYLRHMKRKSTRLSLSLTFPSRIGTPHLQNDQT
jgi:hypothetical protein